MICVVGHERRHHINYKEFKASIWALRWRLRSLANWACRCFHVADSAVDHCVWNKGRSASWRLHVVLSAPGFAGCLCFVVIRIIGPQ